MKKNRKEHIIVHVAFTAIVFLAIAVVLITVMSSSHKAARRDLDAAKASTAKDYVPEKTPVPTPTQKPGPQQEEVWAMRKIVLEGMKEEDINALCSLVKEANQTIESKDIYNKFFQQLSDPDNLFWNTFEQTGEIQIGWGYDGKIPKSDVMEEENLTEDEFFEKYGQVIAMHNDYNAEDFAQMLEQGRETVINEALRSDLQYVIDEVRLAAETHDVAYVKNMYHALHDLDYFLLNYRLDTEGQYIRDKSTISRYYGALSVYEEQHE